MSARCGFGTGRNRNKCETSKGRKPPIRVCLCIVNVQTNAAGYKEVTMETRVKVDGNERKTDFFQWVKKGAEFFEGSRREFFLRESKKLD